MQELKTYAYNLEVVLENFEKDLANPEVPNLMAALTCKNHWLLVKATRPKEMDDAVQVGGAEKKVRRTREPREDENLHLPGMEPKDGLSEAPRAGKAVRRTRTQKQH